MSIETRLNAINDHLVDDYSVLTLAGADLTNVDKNIVNLKPTWKERLLYFMNNGTDEVWNNWGKVVGSGTSITLNNTLYAPMKIEYGGNTSQNTITGETGTEVQNTSINVSDLNTTKESYITLKGNTYQETTTGKNILNFKDYLTTNGATFTENSDGSITLTTTQALYDNPYVFSDTDINVSLSGIITEGTATNVRLGLQNAASTSQGSIANGTTTLLNKNASKIRLNWSSGGTVTIKNLMLEKGASVTDYEPYTNGASPNPSYPQPIDITTGDNKVEVCGKNLFNKNTYNTSTSYAYSNRLLSTDQIMIMSFKDKDTSIDISSLNIGFVIYDGVTSATLYKWIIRDGVIREDRTNISSQNENVYCMQWFAYPNNAIETLTQRYDIQIEKGNQATTYEAYQGNTYTVDLGSTELCKIGNYQDRIYKAGDKWYLHKEVGKDNVNIGSTTTYQSKTAGIMSLASKISNANSGCYCYKAKWVDRSQVNANTNECYDNANNVVFVGTAEDTLETLQTKFNGAPIYYILKEQTNTEITDSALLTQLNTLYNATTYSTTNINTTTSNLLPYIDLRYNVVTPSPSPDRPSEVKVVSGDNEILVRGKNLAYPTFDKPWGVSGSGNARTITTNSAYLNRSEVVKVEPSTTYTVSGDFSMMTTNYIRILSLDEKPQVGSVSTKYDFGASPFTFTTDTKTQYIVLYNSENVNTTVSNLQLEKGSSQTTFAPYQENTHTISLGVNNLLPINEFTLVKGTNRTIQINFPTPIPAGTYTLSCKIKDKNNLTSSLGLSWALYDSGVSPSVSRASFTNILDTTTSSYSNTKTTTGQSTHLYIYLNSSLGDDASITIEELQLESGSTAHGFMPYGKQIEMCKIGTYQDKFIRNSGKNLCDIENLAKTSVYASYTYNNGVFTMTPTQTTNNGRLQFVVPKSYFIEGEKYTISEIGANKLAIGYASNVSDTSHFNYFGGGNGISQYTFTYTSIPDDYVCFYLYNNSQTLGTNWTIREIQIEKGETATTYEPYGNGDWYLEKKIGKYTFTGLESWSTASYGTNTWSNTTVANTNYIEANLQILSNIFRGIPASERATAGNNVIYLSSNTTTIIRNTTYTTLEQVRTATQGNYIYYALATPTYTKIEGTLASQLEAIKRSYEEQTNLSQSNNDLPFVLSVSALSQEV